ncbi:MAG: capsule biosynthesis protein [Roseobacter sp.]
MMPPRVFLFLQGPHGPFFAQLARQLRMAGSVVWRVGFNTGDRVFWPDHTNYLPYKGSLTDWPADITQLLIDRNVSDIVLYGDTRPIHAHAIKAAQKHGARVHVFEEGYLRPYWITYERDGSNGHSVLMDTSIAQMQALQDARGFEPPIPPSHWGDMRQHVFYGALYHWFVLFWNRAYPQFQPHRSLNVKQEFALYIKRLILMPLQAAQRLIATRRIKSGSFPYHMALLQLEHDSSFQMHSPYNTQTQFIEQVITGFASGAPPHHHLVFKAHPLEDGRAPLRQDIERFAKQHGLEQRVHWVRGGKLAGLLNDAVSAVTVNSTAGQQVLWRGIPLRAFGTAVYAKPELVSDQSMSQFFANPQKPNQQSYTRFRDFLLSTSQLPGSFYASKGRRQVLRRIVDMMLKEASPYATPIVQSEADRQQLHVVK